MSNSNEVALYIKSPIDTVGTLRSWQIGLTEEEAIFLYQLASLFESDVFGGGWVTIGSLHMGIQSIVRRFTTEMIEKVQASHPLLGNLLSGDEDRIMAGVYKWMCAPGVPDPKIGERTYYMPLVTHRVLKCECGE